MALTHSHSTGGSSPNGYSLIELWVTLSVFIILASFAIPAFSGLMHRTQSLITINSLATAYQLARNGAISTRQSVVFCAQTPGENKCGEDWLKGAIVFTDTNNNRVLDEDKKERVLTVLPALPEGSQIVLKAALRKHYLRFMPNGMLENTAGTLTYCPPNGKSTDARIMIFSVNGRLRFGIDKDNDGIREDANGKALQCPLI